MISVILSSLFIAVVLISAMYGLAALWYLISGESRD